MADKAGEQGPPKQVSGDKHNTFLETIGVTVVPDEKGNPRLVVSWKLVVAAFALTIGLTTTLVTFYVNLMHKLDDTEESFRQVDQNMSSFRDKTERRLKDLEVEVGVLKQSQSSPSAPID